MLLVHDLPEAADDWVSTIGFYTALHRIEAWFALKYSVHLHGHAERDDWIAKARELRRTVYPNYCELRSCCDKARYDCVQPGRNEIDTRVLPALARLEAEIATLP